MKKFSSDESYVYVNVVLLLIILALVVYCCIKNRERFNGPFLSGTCVLPQNQESDGSCLDPYGKKTDWGSMIGHGLDDAEFKVGSQKISPKQACDLCLNNESISHLSDKEKKSRCVKSGMCKE